jgi:hypothetical protein
LEGISFSFIAGQGLVLCSHFHLLYTVVPAEVTVPVDWNCFHAEYLSLAAEERRILHALSLPELAIVQLIVTGRRKVSLASACSLNLAIKVYNLYTRKILIMVNNLKF